MKITDKILYDHVAEARDIWLKTIPEDSETPKHLFSEEFNAEMDKLIANPYKHKKSFKGLQRIAAVLVAFLVGVGSWFVVDAEARTAFVKWVRIIYEDYISYQFQGETPDECIPDFYCAWVPEGMEAIEYSNLIFQGVLSYSGEADPYCFLQYMYMQEGASSNILTSSSDGLDYESVEINGMPGDFYSENEDGCFNYLLTWVDEEKNILFSIDSRLPPEDIFRMAESVQEGVALELLPEHEFTWLPEGYEKGKELLRGSHARQISSLKKDKGLSLKYEVLKKDSLEEHFRIKSEAPGIPLTVWDQDAVLYLNTRPDENSLLWLDEGEKIAFRLDASEDQETMLAIAEAVKRK